MKKSIFIIVILSIFFSIKAQEDPQDQNVSIFDQHFVHNRNLIAPTTKAFQQVEFTPNTQYNGKITKQIDLFTHDVGGVDFSLNLSYVSSSLKVQNVSDRYGEGWSLSGHGMITREIRGMFEDNRYFVSPSVAIGWRRDRGIEPSTKYDTEPDIFRVNAPGLKSSFVIEQISRPYNGEPLTAKIISGDYFTIENIIEEDISLPDDELIIDGEFSIIDKSTTTNDISLLISLQISNDK